MLAQMAIERTMEQMFAHPNPPQLETDESQAETIVDAAELDDAESEPRVSEFALSPVQQYLHDIGTVKLLTRERESEIAKRIETGQQQILQAIFSPTWATRYFLDLGDALARGELLKLSQTHADPISLQTPVWGNGDELGDFLEDRIHAEPESQASDSFTCTDVRKALSILTPRQETVLRMRFGIGLKRDYTLEELGEKFAVTRERVRQIEQQSMRILRHPQRRKPLRPEAKEAVVDALLN